jgi:hypothetical protein
MTTATRCSFTPVVILRIILHDSHCNNGELSYHLRIDNTEVLKPAQELEYTSAAVQDNNSQMGLY